MNWLQKQNLYRKLSQSGKTLEETNAVYISLITNGVTYTAAMANLGMYVSAVDEISPS